MSEHVSPSGKREWAPLLRVGRHDKSLLDLEMEYVLAFPESSTRPDIFNALVKLIRTLERANIEGEIWIDGSFVTCKPDPEDVDIAIRLNGSFYDSATLDQQDTIKSVVNKGHWCDCYVFTEYSDRKGTSQEDLYWLGELNRARWMTTFGVSRSNEPKGIAVYKLVPSEYALRPARHFWRLYGNSRG